MRSCGSIALYPLKVLGRLVRVLPSISCNGCLFYWTCLLCFFPLPFLVCLNKASSFWKWKLKGWIFYLMWRRAGLLAWVVGEETWSRCLCVMSFSPNSKWFLCFLDARLNLVLNLGAFLTESDSGFLGWSNRLKKWIKHIQRLSYCHLWSSKKCGRISPFWTHWISGLGWDVLEHFNTSNRNRNTWEASEWSWIG